MWLLSEAQRNSLCHHQFPLKSWATAHGRRLPLMDVWSNIWTSETCHTHLGAQSRSHILTHIHSKAFKKKVLCLCQWHLCETPLTLASTGYHCYWAPGTSRISWHRLGEGPMSFEWQTTESHVVLPLLVHASPLSPARVCPWWVCSPSHTGRKRREVFQD